MLALALALALTGATPTGPVASPSSVPASPPAAKAPAPSAPQPAPAPVMVVPLPAAAPLPAPFPVPHVVPLTPDLRSDLGTVQSVDPPKGILRCTTTAGLVTYKAAPTLRVTDKDGKPLGGLERLAVGNAVRVYYVIAQGAIAGEVALQ